MTATSPLLRFDVAVVGAGPAGATAARLLVRWGHRVVLIDGPRARHDRAESLPPSVRRLFQLLGILRSVDGAGFPRSEGHTVWWGSAEPRVERFPDDRGYHVRRQAFDDHLRSLVRATVVHGRVVDASGPGHVRLSDGTRIDALWILDASGRAGVLARQGLRTPGGGRTVGLCGLWRCTSGWPGFGEARTAIESYRDGWAWSVPVSRTERQVTFMVDLDLSQIERGRGMPRAYAAELGKARAFGRALSSSELVGQPWGWEASSYRASQYAGAGWLLVGDAGSFVDPLASYGVRKAMASAWLAAVVVHTCLRRPERATLAAGYFDEREAQVYEHLQRRTAGFLRDAGSDHPFWTASPDVESPPFYRQSELDRAWQQLKEADRICLRPGPGVGREVRAGVEGHEIVPRDALVAPGLPPGLQFVQGVDVVRLVEMAADFSTVPDLFDGYNRGSQPVELPNFLGVLALLLANDVLRNGPRGTEKG